MSRGSSRCLQLGTCSWYIAAAAKTTDSSESHYVRTKVSPMKKKKKTWYIYIYILFFFLYLAMSTIL